MGSKNTKNVKNTNYAKYVKITQEMVDDIYLKWLDEDKKLDRKNPTERALHGMELTKYLYFKENVNKTINIIPFYNKCIKQYNLDIEGFELDISRLDYQNSYREGKDYDMLSISQKEELHKKSELYFALFNKWVKNNPLPPLPDYY